MKALNVDKNFGAVSGHDLYSQQSYQRKHCTCLPGSIGDTQHRIHIAYGHLFEMIWYCKLVVLYGLLGLILA